MVFALGPSSATRRFMPEKYGDLRPTAPTCTSIFPTMAGLDAPPRQTSTCAWRGYAPWRTAAGCCASPTTATPFRWTRTARSEEHTSELQSRRDLVCRLLLEKKKKKNIKHSTDKLHTCDNT